MIRLILLYIVIWILSIQVQVECYYPLVPNAVAGLSFQRTEFVGKLILVSIIMVDVDKLRMVADACDLSGKDLVDFCREERKEKDRIDREVRAHQLEVRRQDREMLELQLRLETLKHEPIHTAESVANTSLSSRPTSRYRAKAPKLPPFDELRDDLDAYIQRFERYALTQELDHEEWAISLSALLKGKALDVYSRLAVDQANDYEILKEALLKRFHLTAVGFRQKFRETKPETGETAPQFIARLDNIFTRWIEMDKTEKIYDGIKDLVLREQFLNKCTTELRLFLEERKPRNVKDMSRLAEQYSDAHGSFGVRENTRKTSYNTTCITRKPEPQTQQFRSPPQARPVQNTYKSNSESNYESRTCYICHKKGHIARDCRNRPKDFTKVANIIASALSSVKSPDSSESLSGEKQPEQSETIACMLASPTLSKCCIQDGHLQLKCGHELPLMSAACRDKNPTSMPVVECVINGRNVSILCDTGCSTVVIRQDLVSPEQMTGQERTCILVDGTIRKAPIAIVQLDTPYFIGSCEALCMPNPVYDIIIYRNISNVRHPQEPDPNWSKPETLNGNVSNEIISAVETRSQKLRQEKPIKKLKVVEQLPEIDRSEIKTSARK